MTVKNGDKVKVHYKGTLADGVVFDSSEGREPLEFTIGQGQVIPGFENGVIGLSAGEKKIIIIPCAEAYGEYSDEAVFLIGKENLPLGMEPAAGQQLQMMSPEGQVFQVIIKEVSGNEVKLDANHPLAGKDLTFELELVKIN
ncbi:MAG: FKBP-type peptidyl-prolyl cis-trans isomerase SlyD [Candidatus Aerophobetes bacterium ADurb.Bin490]|nr:MAG: FKBP-type peptidyl-prolyl cis-trans isomerase SlyD [Candidatus Aerophobetes bacterium ADurb.Bin490]